MVALTVGVRMSESDEIHYGNLMHDAKRSLIARVLRDIETTGKLPGEHHFFVTFDTNHPDAELADWLKDRYQDEMTVVIQHWFDNLTVDSAGFAITLNFGDSPEPLYIPFKAIRTFVDPSVEFGLRFEADDEDFEDEAEIEVIPEVEPDDSDEKPAQAAEVVSLDAFRKT